MDSRGTIYGDQRQEPSISPPFDRLTPDLQRLRLAAKRHEKRFFAGESHLADEFQQLYEARKTKPHPLGRFAANRAGWSERQDLLARDVARGTRAAPRKAKEQEDLARLSSNSRFATDPTSGHHIYVENPALLVDAIRDVVDAVRSKKPLAKIR